MRGSKRQPVHPSLGTQPQPVKLPWRPGSHRPTSRAQKHPKFCELTSPRLSLASLARVRSRTSLHDPTVLTLTPPDPCPSSVSSIPLDRYRSLTSQPPESAAPTLLHVLSASPVCPGRDQHAKDQ